MVADGVGGRDRVDPRSGEDLANLGHVIDRHQEAALEGAQVVGQAGKIALAEHRLAIVVLAAPIGRVEIEERARAVITRQEVGPVQAFDGGAAAASGPCPKINLSD